MQREEAPAGKQGGSAQRTQLLHGAHCLPYPFPVYTHTHTHIDSLTHGQCGVLHIMCISFTVSISARLHCESGRKNQQEYANTHTRTLQTALCVQYPVCVAVSVCACLWHISLPLPVEHKMYCGHFNIK